jgi:guanylate kinase
VLLVLAGPSGVGKGTIVRALRERLPGLWVSVSYTTRPPRVGEVEGVDYHFVSRAEFEALRDRGGFVEWFEVFGDLKGTPRGPVEEHLAAGDDVLLEIDVQGALTVRRMFPDAVLVFVEPPSPEELRRRLASRGTESPEDLQRRLAAAAAEEAQADLFDEVVVNDDVESAVAQVAGILDRSRSTRPAEPGDP